MHWDWELTLEMFFRVKKSLKPQRCDVDYLRVVSLTKEAMQTHLDVVSLQVHPTVYAKSTLLPLHVR